MTSVSTASRVVPGAGLTLTRASPHRRLRRDDFPTLGLPTIATRISSSGPGPSSSTTGRRVAIASTRSAIPRPCSAEIGIGSPRPSSYPSAASSARKGTSDLFQATRTLSEMGRRLPASSRSPAVSPARASRTRTTTCASSTAMNVWRRISSWRPSGHAPRIAEQTELPCGAPPRVNPVPGGAREVGHQGPALTEQAVENSRFSRIRDAQEGDNGNSRSLQAS